MGMGIFFFIAALGIQLNELMKLKEDQRSTSFFELAKVIQISKLNV